LLLPSRPDLIPGTARYDPPSPCHAWRGGSRGPRFPGVNRPAAAPAAIRP